MSQTFERRYENDPRNVALARGAIADFAVACGFGPDCIDEIRLAAGEALSNASEHGCNGKSGHFGIRCTFDCGELTIDISDNGRGFEPTLVVGASTIPDERGRGFGMFLMRRLMDSVSFEECGKRVRLTRRVSRPC